MAVTSAITSTYEHKPPPEAPKNKANSNPIKTNQTRRLTARKVIALASVELPMAYCLGTERKHGLCRKFKYNSAA